MARASASFWNRAGTANRSFAVPQAFRIGPFTEIIDDGDFGICSRNLWMDESNLLVRLARRLKLEEKLREVRERRGFDLAVQAEVIGPGIQKNKYELKEVTLRVFNVLDVQSYRLLDHAMMLEVIGELGLDAVPQLGTIALNHSVDELVAFSEGTS